jgi:hypothetical protein
MYVFDFTQCLPEIPAPGPLQLYQQRFYRPAFEHREYGQGVAYIVL